MTAYRLSGQIVTVSESGCGFISCQTSELSWQKWLRKLEMVLKRLGTKKTAGRRRAKHNKRMYHV